MIRQYELIDKILKYNPRADIALLNRAYVFSMKAHGNQKRASGQPYLVHPLEVASILADLKMDEATIATGLLHDTLEDTLATPEELKNLFGAEVAELTDGVTKLSRIEFNSKAAEQAENFRKLLMAMSKDLRVLLVKLADRLHNMRTLHHVEKPEKRVRKAQETMEIFAPLADRIGLHAVKTELEDLSFREINPEAYKRLEDRLIEVREQDNLVDRVVEILEEELKNANIEAKVFGREKTIYSIYRKMHKKNLAFDQLTDIVAYRVLVADKAACYETLGMIHNVFKAIPGRFKDYISAPKPNGYQSLHTSVIGPFGNRMEIQIRTEDMHNIAENGVAAHWLYKAVDPKLKREKMDPYGWVRHLVESLQETEDPEEFLENAKVALFTESVFVFTPKGDLFALPAGATPLDFAYHIHSDIGNRCQGAKINGKIVPLKTPLENGDQIEVITGKTPKPSPGWREFVVTAKARSAINKYLRAQEEEEQTELGRDMLEKAAKRDGITFNESALHGVLGKLPNVQHVHDVYKAIAQGRLFVRQIFDQIAPHTAAAAAYSQPMPADAAANLGFTKPTEENAIGIEGLTHGMSLHLARCCHPVPGEDIVGIIHTGRGVTIHNKACHNLEALSDQPDRFIPVRWNLPKKVSEKQQAYPVRLKVSMHNKPGALAGFTTAVFNAGGNIIDLHSEGKYSDVFIIRCDVEVHDVQHLQSLMAVIAAVKTVNHVERVVN